MAFIDDLALVEALIGMLAVLFAYVGLLSWWAIRTNNPEFLRKTLKTSAVPIGGLGALIFGLGLWIEVAWPFTMVINGTNVLGGYNIFFGDVMVLCGLTALVYAAVAHYGGYLHLAGVTALLAGGVTAFYAWTGYTASPAFTLDPWDTAAMYSAFALGAFAALPASLIADYYLTRTASNTSFWQRALAPAKLARSLGTRAAQSISPSDSSASGATSTTIGYRCHWALQLVMLAFPVLMGLAAIAAFWYFGTTLPGHLGHGAAGAP